MDQPTNQKARIETWAERKQRTRFHADMYEKCLARFLIARQMIRLGEIPLADQYLNSVDEAVLQYANYIRRNECADDKRGLKFLVRFVYLEIDSLNTKPNNGERWDLDKRYYLNKISLYGW